MAAVASILEMIGTRMDALQSEVNKLKDSNLKTELSANPETSSNERSITDTVDVKDLQTRISDVEAQIERTRAEVSENKSQQSASMKRERSVTEAVLTQKLEKLVGEKGSTSSKKVDETSENVARMAERINAITAAVDKQAKFLTELNHNINRSINAAVTQAVSNAVSQLKAPEKSGDGDESGELSTLEDSPALDEDAATVDDKDQIDMVEASSGSQDGGKPKPRAKRKPAAKATNDA